MLISEVVVQNEFFPDGHNSPPYPQEARVLHMHYAGPAELILRLVLHSAGQIVTRQLEDRARFGSLTLDMPCKREDPKENASQNSYAKIQCSPVK